MPSLYFISRFIYLLYYFIYLLPMGAVCFVEPLLGYILYVEIFYIWILRILNCAAVGHR